MTSFQRDYWLNKCINHVDLKRTMKMWWCGRAAASRQGGDWQRWRTEARRAPPSLCGVAGGKWLSETCSGYLLLCLSAGRNMYSLLHLLPKWVCSLSPTEKPLKAPRQPSVAVARQTFLFHSDQIHEEQDGGTSTCGRVGFIPSSHVQTSCGRN